MKISKLLNKINILFFLFFVFLSSSIANEPVDIWNIDKTKLEEDTEDQNKSLILDEESEEKISVYDLNSQNNESNKSQVFLENSLENKISLYGLYDPDENNLSIEMWSQSDGAEIKKIFNNIFSKNLSRDALDLLEVILLTNSNTPTKNISREEFYNFQKNFLIKNNDLELIKLFVENNPNFFFIDDLINYYANYYLAQANIEKSCEIFDSLNEVALTSDYSSKLKIYCLINSNKIDQALLIYDLKKEVGLKDNFFEKKTF